MRVLHLATTYPLHEADSNAAFVEAIAEGLAARGHEIEVLVPWHPDLVLDRPDARARLLAFRYSPIRSWHPWGYAQALRGDRELTPDAYLAAPLASVASGWSLRRRLRAADWDLVHAHWLLPNAPIMAAATGRSGPPMVISCHGSGVYLAERFGWTAAVARWAMRRAAAITGCSGDICERLSALDAGPVPRRIPYGVDVERFRPASAEVRAAARRRLADAYGLPEGDAWIVAVGRLVYKKGFDVLVRALPRVLEIRRDARVVIVGSGPLAEPLRKAAVEAGVGERVHLVGPISHARIPELYSAADLIAVPSVHGPGGNVDGLPNVLLESLASGAAIVASSVAGIPDVVDHGDNGMLFPEGDAIGLAEAAGRLLAEPEARRRLGERARTRAVESLSWERICERFEEVYMETLG